MKEVDWMICNLRESNLVMDYYMMLIDAINDSSLEILEDYEL